MWLAPLAVKHTLHKKVAVNCLSGIARLHSVKLGDLSFSVLFSFLKKTFVEPNAVQLKYGAHARGGTKKA